ncbi:MAG: hypothetical protein NT130_03880 [Candidatus Micrarchaeota archaeon]|nr:hypothetical protein [Candidatus Micrarchaeota archaeon]
MAILDKLRKGQVWSYDLIISSILFVIALGILAFFWWSARTNMTEEKDTMTLESIKVADTLVSPGSPTDWQSSIDVNNQSTWSNIQQIGLGRSWSDSDSNVISTDKLYSFQMMSFNNYSFTKSRLRSQYDYYIQFIIHNSNGSDQMVKLNGLDLWVGKPFNEITARMIAKTDRVVVYNHSLVIMRVLLWSESPWD